MTTPDPATTDEFRPTHVVPPDGLPAWEAPDASRPTVPLDADRKSVEEGKSGVA
ncbi:hypothetical protein [Streptomyces mirabilis]|uniref:hypothetical protein n=1 Tax=Streptomyces mirabilis TaxID=68239 RepID=UPI0033AD2FC4